MKEFLSGIYKFKIQPCSEVPKPNLTEQYIYSDVNALQYAPGFLSKQPQAQPQDYQRRDRLTKACTRAQLSSTLTHATPPVHQHSAVTIINFPAHADYRSIKEEHPVKRNL